MRKPLVCVRPPGWVGADATDHGAAILAWAEHAEALGLDGVFLGDRLLGQAVSGAGNRVVYGASMLEVTTTLAAIAARTERLLLGPLVFVFPYRHPIQLAKTVATLDVLAQGRVVLGAGIGWNQAEFEALGIPTKGRGPRFEEQLHLVRRLWSGDSVGHDGSWTFKNAQVTPVPYQPGGPPVWLASFSPDSALDWRGEPPAHVRRVLRRVARVADGWVPLIYSASSRRRLDAEVLARGWEYIQSEAAKHSRTRSDISFVYSDWCFALTGPDSVIRCQRALDRFFAGSWEEATRTYTIGRPAEIVAAVKNHTSGIDHVDAYVLTPLSDDPEQLEILAQEVAPLLRESEG